MFIDPLNTQNDFFAKYDQYKSRIMMTTPRGLREGMGGHQGAVKVKTGELHGERMGWLKCFELRARYCSMTLDSQPEPETSLTPSSWLKQLMEASFLGQDVAKCRNTSATGL